MSTELEKMEDDGRGEKRKTISWRGWEEVTCCLYLTHINMLMMIGFLLIQEEGIIHS